MPSITLTFSAPLNASCQVGDTAYYVTTASSGGFTTSDASGPIEIGQIRQISGATSSTPTIICDTVLPGVLNSQTKFILGYFASVKLVNDSTVKSELYSVAMDTFASSGAPSLK